MNTMNTGLPVAAVSPAPLDASLPSWKPLCAGGCVPLRHFSYRGVLHEEWKTQSFSAIPGQASCRLVKLGTLKFWTLSQQAVTPDNAGQVLRQGEARTGRE